MVYGHIEGKTNNNPIATRYKESTETCRKVIMKKKKLKDGMVRVKLKQSRN